MIPSCVFGYPGPKARRCACAGEHASEPANGRAGVRVRAWLCGSRVACGKGY